MALLQPKLNLRVAQRQVLTPGLMQMVSVLALNKLELKEMIDAEMVENPVLEEIDESVPMFDEVAGREEQRERPAEETPAPAQDSFNEVDFGSYFQEYLDPGYRTTQEYEESEKPSFENFLSQPTTLSDHLAWQLGALTLDQDLETAAEFIIGNLDENGYLSAGEDELTAAFEEFTSGKPAAEANGHTPPGQNGSLNGTQPETSPARELVRRGIDLVQHFDPAGVGARDLRECLLIQIAAQQLEFEALYERRHAAAAVEAEDEDEDVDDEDLIEEDVESPHGSLQAAAEEQLEKRRRAMAVAAQIVDKHLQLLQKRDVKDLSKAVQASPEDVHAAVDFIRTLDPRPGRLYNREQTRLIEPDVQFVKQGGEWVVSMNEEDLPSLRLSRRYRQMLASQTTDREVKDYVKERFRSALQLMRNIAQRKSTILRTCEVIVRRQVEFLEEGIESLRPLMIKEVAEEIGVHPSTVSRAVANKYAHTPQGVIELRAFFSEGANGPEGADTPLVVLKRKVRKLIEEEDPKRPLTDDQLAAMLQAQGIQLTRRTVAKYREDMNIPSTHQRRRRD
ncbi:RNA polymerase factor sigma-54 [Occallatibacter riparius]|uniref:RNA polymerase sigma-54 factor n=1 Tax=Occallatibacter riparius TaxID=1002689 RepID=A0A9J7BLG6_9BACT|nr:RNA polymerase sigma-54 factor [Occallatibacter riparius]UWZ83491.1 RNA polymerase sigma-54 factor [Occallatibacter riparius]